MRPPLLLIAVFIILSFSSLIGPSRGFLSDEGAAKATNPQCSTCPVCDRGAPSTWLNVRHCIPSTKAPLYLEEFKQRAHECLKHQLQRIHGQPHVVDDVVTRVLQKMHSPTEPLIMHFAGDNGVGKTHMARLISQALSLHCGNPDCTVGSSLLTISGTAYDGLPLADARRAIIMKIAPHARMHPHGIILLDDVSQMSPDLVRALAPLLGRAEHFPEAEDVHLPSLTVILTTDFGREGRARGKSLDELVALVNLEFTTVYSQSTASMIRTYAFLPIGTQTAQEIVATELRQLPCVSKNVVNVTFDDTVPRYVVRRVMAQEQLVSENGRAIQLMVRDLAGGLVAEQLAIHGDDYRFDAHFAWAAEADAVVLVATAAAPMMRP